MIGGNTDLQFDQSNQLIAVGGQPTAANQIGDATGAAEYFTITSSNPYVFNSSLANVGTPNIEGLIGGAEQFGFIDGINAVNLGSGFNLTTAIDFDISVANGVFNNAPSNASHRPNISRARRA